MKLPIYLDNAATTALDPRVLSAMHAVLHSDTDYGNAASSHTYGWQASELVESARQSVAALIGARASEIIFTSGATEANNLAIQGVARQFPKKAIITCTAEHPSVLNTCQAMSMQGHIVTILKPDSSGLLNMEQLKAILQPDTALVSIMLVNNETGVIQDIAAISQLDRKSTRLNSSHSRASRMPSSA